MILCVKCMPFQDFILFNYTGSGSNSNITMKRKHLPFIKENLIKCQCSVILSEHFIYFSEIRFYYVFF